MSKSLIEVAAKSYLDARARNAFANCDRVIRLHPAFTASVDEFAEFWVMPSNAPLTIAGPAVDAARGFWHLARCG